MIQLSYEPAYDVYYAIFRMLRLRESLKISEPIQKGKFRILDFYLQFPYLIDNIRLKREDLRFRALAKKYQTKRPYGFQPEQKVIFDRMEPIQEAALQTLTVDNFYSSDAYTRSTVLADIQPLSPKILERVRELNSSEQDLLEFLGILQDNYQFEGPNGLKDRTSLLEFRYDTL